MIVASPAKAITNGEPDNGRHPYVGLAVFDTASGPSHRCSASLLSATVVLTAGHCTDGTVCGPGVVRRGRPEQQRVPVQRGHLL